MKTITNFLIVGIMLYFLGHEQWGHAILYGCVVLFLTARNQEIKQRKPGRKYIN